MRSWYRRTLHAFPARPCRFRGRRAPTGRAPEPGPERVDAQVCGHAARPSERVHPLVVAELPGRAGHPTEQPMNRFGAHGIRSRDSPGSVTSRVDNLVAGAGDAAVDLDLQLASRCRPTMNPPCHLKPVIRISRVHPAAACDRQTRRSVPGSHPTAAFAPRPDRDKRSSKAANVVDDRRISHMSRPTRQCAGAARGGSRLHWNQTMRDTIPERYRSARCWPPDSRHTVRHRLRMTPPARVCACRTPSSRSPTACT